jgi:hypothetical protein
MRAMPGIALLALLAFCGVASGVLVVQPATYNVPTDLGASDTGVSGGGGGGGGHASGRL